MDKRPIILIADSNEDFCQQLKAALDRIAEYGVHTATDGLQTGRLLRTLHPDVLILDLALANSDTAIAIRSSSVLEKPPITVVTSSLSEEYIKSKASGLGAQYYTVKPCDCETLARHICEICDAGRNGAIYCGIEPDVELMVTEIIRELGIPAHIKGYAYLRKAIIMVVNDMDVINAITKELYPQVAKTFSSTAPRVERAIRNAIETAWKRGNQEALRRCFGNTLSSRTGKPTNSEFIATIADQLRLQIRRGRNITAL